jgi:hypothetical protein
MRVKSLLVVLFAVALAATAAAQTKISGTTQCKADPATPVAVDDKPGHAFSVSKAQCVWSKLEMAGVAAKTGVSVAQAEIMGDTTTARGFHTGTMANGDKWTCSFEGKTTMKDGKPVSDAGTWSFTDGTGKLKGIAGKGTFKGAPNADGSMTYQIDGDYSLPK